MTTRNFEYRVSPRGPERGSRYVLKADEAAPRTKGVPVKTTGDFDAQGRAVVSLVTGAQDKPKAGQGGILDFELFRKEGLDNYIQTYSDYDTVEAGTPVQVVTGENRVRINYRNTEDGSFYSRAGYPAGRIMIAGVSIATPTVALGDYLTPGTGNDTAGYWAETSDIDEAWLVVQRVDKDTGDVEVTVNF